MAGITRIKIVSDWHDWRTQMAEDLAPTADEIYRAAFAGKGLLLAEGTEYVQCTKEEAKARYDWCEGIDVILQFARGGKATLQEKFLDYDKNTVTFEEYKTSGQPGAWYYCTAQYYFVGYARQYKAQHVLAFQSWMLVNLPQLRMLYAQELVPWGEPRFNTPDNPLGIRKNGRDGRGASFRYVYFPLIPRECVIASDRPYPSNGRIERVPQTVIRW